MKRIFVLTSFIALLIAGCQQLPDDPTVRFATFNTALYRHDSAMLKKDLEDSHNKQLRIIAEIIQRTRPDVLALQEFDYDASGHYLALFQDNFLSKPQNQADTILYRYRLPFPSNTGLNSGFDYDNNGHTGDPGDAFGFGAYEGQYAFALLSRYPFDTMAIRTFQHFLWKDMPQNLMPVDSNGQPYYSGEEINHFRLSSKNHVDVPLKINNKVIHAIIAHPTPPVFDGSEDRNGTRNFDEIRMLSDYISGVSQGGYLYDDNHREGGLPATASFVIMGDMNADPNDGDSYPGAINQLLENPRVHPEVATGDMIPSSRGAAAQKLKNPRKGEKSHHTSIFGLRIDYVLPSADFQIKDSGVFWYDSAHPFHHLTVGDEGSDHRLVWVDILVK